MSETGCSAVDFSECAERLCGAFPVPVEHPECHLAHVGHGVAGEQDAVRGEVDCDAAVGVAGRGDDVRTADDVEDLRALQFDRHRYARRCRRETGRHTLMDRHFPVFEVRCGRDQPAPDDLGIAGSGGDGRTGALVHRGG